MPFRVLMSLADSSDRDIVRRAVEVVRTLRDGGHEAYFAGGAVRDLLLERPFSDIDIATSARPGEVERLFPRTLGVGREFGVMLVLEKNHTFEVATFREESCYSDGRHPDQVTFSNAEQDARRRDFTVNALFYDPTEDQVIDFVGGRADLEDGRIRTVGKAEDRFEEDKLRMLRAIRFACALDFEIAAPTFEAIRPLASTILQVSWERIRDELIKTLTSPRGDRGLQLLWESGLLAEILPEVAAMVGVEQPPEYHPEGDVFEHTKLMFRLADEGLSTTLALGILLHDVGKPPTFRVEERIRFDGHAERGAEMAEEICNRIRLSRSEVLDVVDLVRHHLRFIHVQEMRESTLKRFLRKPNFHEHLELHRLDCLSSHRNLDNYHFCREKLEEFSREKMRPRPLLNGQDLIDHGLEPGPLFGKILGELEDLQLEDKIQSREEALEWLERYPELG